MYHYTECGLSDVWLVNGYRIKTTPYGEGVSIRDVAGLHAAIAKAVIAKPGRLSGREFRFLRLRLEWAQSRLATYFGCDAQAIARWEKGRTPVPRWADRFVRAVYREVAENSPGIVKLVERLKETESESRPQAFRRTSAGWRPTAKAA